MLDVFRCSYLGERVVHGESVNYWSMVAGAKKKQIYEDVIILQGLLVLQ